MDYSIELLRECQRFLNELPNKNYNGYRAQSSYDLATLIRQHFERNKIDTQQIIHSNLFYRYDNEYCNYSGLAYSTETKKDFKGIVYHALIIHSTSMSELEGSEEGELGTYLYDHIGNMNADIMFFQKNLESFDEV